MSEEVDMQTAKRTHEEVDSSSESESDSEPSNKRSRTESDDDETQEVKTEQEEVKTEDTKQEEVKTEQQQQPTPAVRTITTSQPWEHDLANPESWELGEKMKWGDQGVFTAFVVNKTDDGKAWNRTFHMPPGVVFEEPALHGLGRPMNKSNGSYENYEFSLVLNFGKLSPVTMQKFPWLMDQHQRFIDAIEAMTPIVIKKQIKRGDDKNGIKTCKAAALNDFDSRHDGYMKTYFPDRKAMVQALLDDGVKTEQEANQLVMQSELLIPGACSDKKHDKLRARILKLVAERADTYQKEKCNELFWNLYTKNMKHIGYIQGEVKGQRTMTLYLNKRSTYEPKKNAKKPEDLKPKQKVADPDLQYYFDFCNSDWSIRAKWPVKYFLQGGKELRDPVTKETYNTLTDDKHNPNLQVLKAGDLVSATYNLRVYYDNNAHVGVKLQPCFDEIVVYARGIPDAEEMLASSVDSGALPAMGDDFGFI